jgi:hypothetical protein
VKKMKRLAIGLAVVSLLAVGALAYAHEHGGRQMGDEGMSCHMMEGCCGKEPMMGHGDDASKKFLDETYALRKELHDKKFEHQEALRNPGTTLETIAKLERDMQGLKEKIREKAPEGMGKRIGSHGCME